MASPQKVKRSIILHNEMISFIGLCLVPAMNEFTQFKTNARSYLFPGDIAQAERADDILLSLETRNHLSTGNYDTLIEILGNSHLFQLRAEVQRRASEIKRQIHLENGGPSESSTSPPPDATGQLSLAGGPSESSTSPPQDATGHLSLAGGPSESSTSPPPDATGHLSLAGGPSEPSTSQQPDATGPSSLADSAASQTKAKDAQIRAKSTGYRSHCLNKTEGTFVITTLYDQARKEIEEKNAVLLLGGIGDGKSSITQYIAANCMEDYLPVPCNYPEEIQQYIDLIQGTNIKLLFVFDDPVGGSYTQHILVDKWVHMLEKLEMYLTQNEHKFLFAMRKTIWADCGVHFQKSKFFCNQIEVTSVNLTSEDKVRMLEKYLGNSGKLSDRHKQKIVADEKPIAFGQCCKLMSDAQGLSSKEIVLVFEKPFSYLCSELERMADKEKEKYAILCVVMFCGSALECKHLRGTLSDVKSDIKEIIDVVVHVCECPNLTCGGLQKCADKLTGTHLEKLQATGEDSSSCEVYQFAHDSIKEAVTMQYGQRHPEHCLKYLNPVIVVNIARPHNYEKREQEFAINFPPENYKELAGMFTTKVIDENGTYSGVSEVFDNPCVKDESFQSVWVDCLKNSSRGKRTAFTQSKELNGPCVLYYLARSGAHTVLSFVCPDRQSECKCDLYDLPCVLRGAIRGNHVQLVRERLSDRPLTGRAVWQAVLSDRADLLSALFDQTSVTHHVTMARYGLMAAAACGYGRVRLADYILTHHCPPCRGLQQDCPCVWGLKYAIVNGQTAIVTLIESHRKTGH